jgi:hypothetical protein
MQVPWHLMWGVTNYTLIGIIFCDPAEGEEHFSSLIEINNKLYEHQLTSLDGLLRPVNTVFGAGTGFRLSDTIFHQKNNVPSRFFYVKGEESGAPSQWASVKAQYQHSDFPLDLSPIDVDSASEVDSESDKPDNAEGFEQDEDSQKADERDVMGPPSLTKSPHSDGSFDYLQRYLTLCRKPDWKYAPQDVCWRYRR